MLSRVFGRANIFGRCLGNLKLNWQSRDFYERMGLKSNATTDEIKKRYREIVKEYHPDRVKDPTKQAEGNKIMAAVNEAYDVLKDEAKRRDYDGRSAFRGGGFNFQSMEIHQEAVQISLFENHFGCTKTLYVTKREPCKVCEGTGSADKKAPEPCPTCDGARYVMAGLFTIPCPTCNGRGFCVDHPCSLCKGDGTVPNRVKVTVPIPPGVESGSVFTYQTEAGVLALNVQIAQEELFEQQGGNLHIIVPLSMKMAMIGGSIRVPTLNGVVEHKVKPGTQPYTIDTIPNTGIHGKGDTIIHYNIIIPKVVLKSEKEAVKHIRDDFMRGDQLVYDRKVDNFMARLNAYKASHT